MINGTPEPIDAIERWVASHMPQAVQDSVELTLRIGQVPDGSRRKVTLGMQRGDRVALVEAWSSGEMDFTLHDFSIGEDGQSQYFECATSGDFEAALDRCYRSFHTQWE